MIFDAARGKHQEVVRSELINNPNVPEEVKKIQRSDSITRTSINDVVPGLAKAKPQRTPSGRLTRVTWRKRLKKLRPSTTIRRLLNDLLSFPGPSVLDGSGDHLPVTTPGLSPAYKKVASFLFMLLVMTVAFGTIAVLIRYSLKF